MCIVVKVYFYVTINTRILEVFSQYPKPYLSKKGSGYKPERVGYGELIFHEVIVRFTRMGIIPLVRRESCHDK